MGAGSNQNYKNAVTVNVAPLQAHLHFGKKRTLGLQEFLFPVVSRIKAQGLLESGIIILLTLVIIPMARLMKATLLIMIEADVG